MDSIDVKIRAYSIVLGKALGGEIPLDQKVAGLHRMLGDIGKDIVSLRARKANMAQSYLYGGPEVQDEQVDQLRVLQRRVEATLQRLESQVHAGVNSTVVSEQSRQADALLTVIQLCTRFPQFARQLSHRREERPSIVISDEYDVQDLFHAVLRLHFDDIRSEEWVPSYAGSSSRMDFLLKDHALVVEIKKMRPTLSPKALGEQLIIDAAKYRRHPDCKMLVCFVYDPDNLIVNPRGIERDLNANNSEGLSTVTVICPK